MRGPFERRCAVQIKKDGATCLAPTTSSISEGGHESLWCSEGHVVKEWYVVDADGKQIALAKLHSAPTILDEEMLHKLSINPLFRKINPPPPDRLCVRGHKDWYMNPDQKYRCRQCKREEYIRNRSKLKAAREAKRLQKVNDFQIASNSFHKKRGRAKNV